MTRLDVATFFLTFTTYGTWLHGDPRGSVDRHYHKPGLPHHPGNLDLLRKSAQRMAQPAFQIDSASRSALESAVREVCEYRNWHLYALNIRNCHLHTVVSGHADGARMMNDFKAYGTRRLVRDGIVPAGRRVWTEGGSVRRVTSLEALERVVAYVLEEQGEPLPGTLKVGELG
ncbi:MAG: hypothetical protein QM765_27065 [Myxococcales bacterium]